MEVRKIRISDASAGMLVAEDVVNDIGQLIFPAEARLTDKAIARIQFHAIRYIRIYLENEEESEPDQSIDELSYFEKLRDSEEYNTFNEQFTDVADTFEKEMMRVLHEGGDTDSRSLSNGVKKILSSCRSGIQVFDLLHCTRSYDEVVFAHSLNVAIIAAVLGGWLDFPMEDIDVLIQCGIYHDIGKLAVPKEIIDKPGALTPDEYAVMRTHTSRGYSILKDMNLDNRVKLAAMMHHERCDGSGYPLGVGGNQIERLTKIIAIADVYEAMTAPRKYRKARCPFEVIKLFESSGLMLFDTKYLMTFIEHIAVCYMGYRVRLNDGTVGTIVYMNRQDDSKPMIQVGSEYIDLFRNPKLYIEEIL
ncbi:MAG: HD-GYP domain-containing protein [Lachnospiraceae bacterium]|nr:HD-GYP domain-containing protein [Lachnospiraceae bacterium]